MKSRDALIGLVCLAVTGCGGGDASPSPSAPSLPPRTYVMGFSAIPPRLDPALVTRNVDLWAQRADAGLVLQEPPWAELLAGQDPEALVRANPLGIANYFRGKGLRVIGSVDPTNGLDRSSDSAALVAAGRSLAEPAVRDLYRRYVGAFRRARATGGAGRRLRDEPDSRRRAGECLHGRRGCRKRRRGRGAPA